ncbi:MAG: serine protease [Treponema sp.]|nr:serine protease [Treponema sp.]MCL2236840.1 serine protease [Treponema sp.]
MIKRVLIFFMLVFLFPVSIFSQTGAAAVRDYVGVINQTYHPDIVSYLQKWKAVYTRQGQTNAARGIDIILSGAFGSGFLYNDARGNFYVITNNHVVAHAHTLSITFERSDGTTRKIENLSIIATDVETDLAILALPAGERPLVNRGLAFASRNVQEGEDVFSAGFPGLGRTPIWQFSRGMVSNANVRFPKSIDDETMMGPYIQHTSQIDAGNSGGPLLIAQTNAPGGFAVVGINTLQGINRQSANYAIPSNKIQEFINSSLNPRPATFRAALDARLEQFVTGFSSNKAAYPHIAEFLSVVCVGENAEWATDELDRRGSQSVKRAFLRTFTESIVDAMALAVAWSIESDLRTSSGALNVALKDVTGEGEQYTVVFSINNRDVESVWIREYGNWRIKTFGTIATGNAAERVVQTQAQRDRAARRANDPMGIQNDGHIEIGFSTLFDSVPAAFYASFGIASWGGINFYYGGEYFMNMGAYLGYAIPIPLEKIGLSPYFRIGVSITSFEPESSLDRIIEAGLLFGGGMKIFFAAVPNLYGNLGVQYVLTIDQKTSDRSNAFEFAMMLTVGYSF